VLVLADRTAGIFLQKKISILFAPNSRAKFHTSEFDFVAEINSMGLRDSEIKPRSGSTFRILCFGDSWTFGWGVNAENSCPKKLEAHLREKGYTAEVINCGKSGECTADYKKNIEELVPLLHPDLVLAGVLQSDDLAQLYENAFPAGHDHPFWFKLKTSLTSFLRESFPNFLSLLKPTHTDEHAINLEWREEAQAIISGFSREQMSRYQTFNDSLKILFESGNLNPALVNSYIYSPDRHSMINDPKGKPAIFAVAQMKKDFEDMKSICNKNSCPLIFIDLPESYYTGHKVVRMPGNDYNEFLYANNKIDSMYKEVAAHVNIPFYELTERFKNLPDKDSYFFKYDGHPTAKGYEEIADAVSEFLIKEKLFEKKNENQD
jgi:lysophospholipase L1-like esterase